MPIVQAYHEPIPTWDITPQTDLVRAYDSPYDDEASFERSRKKVQTTLNSESMTLNFSNQVLFVFGVPTAHAFFSLHTHSSPEIWITMSFLDKLQWPELTDWSVSMRPWVYVLVIA